MMKKTEPKTGIDEFSMLLADPMVEFADDSESGITVVLKSDSLGSSGQASLGSALVQELFQSLLDYPEPPEQLLLYHRAVNLAMTDSHVGNLLAALAKKGTEILLCRQSCESLAGNKRQVAGEQVPFQELVARMRQAEKILWF